jgi:hypothetical protein
MLSKNKIIIIIVVVIVAVMAFVYLKNSGDNSQTSLVSEAKSSQSADSDYVLKLLNRMSKIKLDDTIFFSQMFSSLKDTTVTLVPQSIGRNNPFAPLGSDGTTSVVNKNTASTSSRPTR